jgi:UTP-glucose-1-phosphate uridylyltransferase
LQRGGRPSSGDRADRKDDSALESLSRQAEPQRELQLTDGFHLAAGAAPGVLAVHFKGHIFDAGTPEEYALSLARFVRSSAGGKPTSAAAALARN